MKSIRRSFPYKQINKNIVYLAVKIDRGTTTGGCDCDITIQDGENLSVADLFRVESDTVLCHRNCALVLDVLGFLLSLTISSRYYIECNRILRSSIIVHNKEILKDFSLTNSYTLIINNHYTGGTRISPETGRNNRGNRVHTQGDITSQNRVSYFVFWEILFQYPFFNPAF